MSINQLWLQQSRNRAWARDTRVTSCYQSNEHQALTYLQFALKQLEGQNIYPFSENSGKAYRCVTIANRGTADPLRG